MNDLILRGLLNKELTGKEEEFVIEFLLLLHNFCIYLPNIYVGEM
jgi:hypothetical protein